MLSLAFLKNTLRNRTRNTLLGRLVQQSRQKQVPRSLRIVSATRLTESEFWRASALGKSLKLWRSNPSISVTVQFENTEGLPHVYNQQFRAEKEADALLFVHDDIWIDDPEWLPKIMVALQRFDIVGVAGNTRRSPRQPAWLFSKLESEQFVWDHPYLSGAVAHGQLPKGPVSVYGPAPARCELIDGAFIAVRREFAQNGSVFLMSGLISIFTI